MCDPNLSCLPSSPYLSGHRVSPLSHLLADKSFRLNAHLTDLSARQRCSGRFTTTVNKGMLTSKVFVTVAITYCNSRGAVLPISVLKLTPSSNITSNSSSSSSPPLNYVKVFCGNDNRCSWWRNFAQGGVVMTTYTFLYTSGFHPTNMF